MNKYPLRELMVCGLVWSLVSCAANQTGTAQSAHTPAETLPAVDVSHLYTQDGADPTFQTILEQKRISVGVNSTAGITGSTIHVNQDILGKLPTAANPIPQNIFIHTLGNSLIPRKDFDKWSRWYQEDGRTQIFRLFKDETNVRNDRPLAARIEAFSELRWTYDEGKWHEWEGAYTIVKPHQMTIFQIKNIKNDWAVILLMTNSGDIYLTNRTPKENRTLAKNMTGKSFVLKMRDNGKDFEVYFNGEKVDEGSYDRPEGTTAFRWGLYRGGREVKHEAMIFITGATFK